MNRINRGIDDIFFEVQSVCRYCITKGLKDFCTEKTNIPKGELYGECSFNKCPMVETVKEE